MIHAAVQLPMCRHIINFYKHLKQGTPDFQCIQPLVNDHASSIFLNSDVFRYILSHLHPDQLEKCNLVSRNWNQIATEPGVVKISFYQHKAFSPEKWAPHLEVANLKEECKKAFASLPNNISKERKKASRAFHGKTLDESEVLVWIPESFSTKALVALLKSHFPESIIENSISENEDQMKGKSRWVSMMIRVLPGSLKMPFDEQKTSIANLAKESKIDYKVPSSLVALACVIAHYIATGERLFGDAPEIFIRLEDSIQDNRAMFGSFSSDGPLLMGLGSYDENKGFSNVGITAMSEVPTQTA